MEIGYIKSRELTTEMKESYLAYAMSVIVARALPDVRDGMKPVHRRILFAMRGLGLTHSAKYRKSALVVGDVLGKYHPHGDTAVYDSMVRMAQGFSLRYPMVDGQGNFGSMDGDNAAAMRYTEAKLTAFAEEMMADIEKETVDFVPNYDASRQEPSVLPAKAPQLLLNGTMGIAVGMATNIPPHNLGELVDAIAYLIENPDCEVKDLTQFVKGPDFPTGGSIFNQSDIMQAYLTGRGSIVCRAETEIVETKSGQFQIIVTEMTYSSNKAAMIEKIADLVKAGKLEGIKDLRDESDKDGVRVVIELKKEAFPKKILNKLYTLTDLQKSFHVNMLALVDGIEPKVLNLKAMLEYFIAHRQVVVTRRTQYDLRIAKERAHILEGLKKALDHIDAVIATIRKSATKELAHDNLMKKFKLSDKQSTAILEMRLQTLAGLERQKIEDELKEKMKLIKELEELLKSPKKILGVIKTELQELKEKYADGRRTKVVRSAVGEFSQEDLIPNEEAIIVLTEDNYVKRMNPSLYRVQRRGGKGVIGATTKEDDKIDMVVSAMTHDDLFFFTNTGKVFQTKAYEIPVSSRTAKGQAIVNFLQVSPDEKITAIITVGKDSQAKYLFMATKFGTVKKTAIDDFAKVRRSGLIALNLAAGDELRWIAPTTGKDEIIITTSAGQAIHFKETDVRGMGRTAAGVRGINLKKDDAVVGMDVVLKNQKGNQVLILTENGFGKRTDLKAYKIQRRGGSGIKTAKITPKTGKLVCAHIVNLDNLETDLIASSAQGQIIRVPLKSISSLGRATQGVRVMRLNGEDKIAATAVL
ncbi:MAG: DNA gyrase subunit A [Candidatus Moranbacteria bacterium]|nr:DNA gyrase subunit A [Candidatus Moranbacteria bacterium]